MAHKLNLAFPLHGLNFIWNIDQRVGTESEEPNDPDDVSLVQLLLGLGIRAGGGVHAAAGCRNAPLVSGQMDHSTGFWIYYCQVEAAGMTADGNLTPSRKTPTIQQLIFRLNNIAASGITRPEWEALPMSPQCPPSLKAKLLAPPK
jgi:hypothetical protein